MADHPIDVTRIIHAKRGGVRMVQEKLNSLSQKHGYDLEWTTTEKGTNKVCITKKYFNKPADKTTPFFEHHYFPEEDKMKMEYKNMSFEDAQKEFDEVFQKVYLPARDVENPTLPGPYKWLQVEARYYFPYVLSVSAIASELEGNDKFDVEQDEEKDTGKVVLRPEEGVPKNKAKAMTHKMHAQGAFKMSYRHCDDEECQGLFDELYHTYNQCQDESMPTTSLSISKKHAAEQKAHKSEYFKKHRKQ